MSPQAATAAQNESGGSVRNGDALARELIDLLGVEGARRMCREHCWDGVAVAIERVSNRRSAA